MTCLLVWNNIANVQLMPNPYDDYQAWIDLARAQTSKCKSSWSLAMLCSGCGLELLLVLVPIDPSVGVMRVAGVFLRVLPALAHMHSMRMHTPARHRGLLASQLHARAD